MSLWDLMTLLSGAAAFGGALASAEGAKNLGSMHFAGALVIGLLAAVACVLVIRALGAASFVRVAKRYQYGEKSGSRLMGAIYFLGFVWAVVSPFFGYQATRLFVEILLLGQ